ncbi:pseudaminic acid synthase [Desulfohalovibrio reitneri]|uniref:pseudaminic acid synthase n=1 Tax=Desulfohalovibrio reitneri TaxID=1307759 RepID=UPI0004A732ED|nr:pseudaminic acid synthase [Desulfohalovibrio reitneri]
MTATMNISGRSIGQDSPVYLIAEMSANHGRDFDRALAILRAAKEAGADAVKLQTYTPDTMTLDCDAEPFRIKGTIWEGRNLHDLYGEAYTPWEWQPKLKKAADDLGLDLFSTPFDATAVDFLEDMGAPAHKVASFEVVDIPLLRKIGATGKPVIMSTGMATLGEIDEAVRTLRGAGCGELALLKCSSAYPAPASDMNLRTIPHLGQAFGAVPGLSDHTLGTEAAVAAVALGARIVEKHFTLSRSDGGPDAAFSLEPEEFASMARAVRNVEQALGAVCYDLTDKQRASAAFRRSLWVAEDIAEGEVLTEKNIRCLRPAGGMHPRHLEEMLGRRASRGLKKGEPLDMTMAASPPNG